MSSISGSSADDDSDEAIKMDVAGILGALKRGTSGSSVTFAHTTYSTNQLKVSDPPLSSIPLSSPQPRSSLLSKSIVTSTIPSSIRTPELMSQIAPSKSVDSADSNGDIEIMLADPAGNHPHDSGSEQQAMLTAFTVWAAQNNIPTSKN
mmetsp:Transcript_29439/g.41699  ORF Transcript_29439/g.41699 Transcript_29439/m.41699 type:complete len:149 (+) Transcript_29439:2164-2610(+)